MSQGKERKFTVKQVLGVQVVVSFVVIAVLVALGGVLVFHVMGAEYTPFTAAGFIATVYLAFIAFQPAGTIFACRKEFIEGKVVLPDQAQAAKAEPVKNPWSLTLPVSVPVALVLTALVSGGIYLGGWKPAPAVVVAISLLFVVPYYLLTSRFIERDLVSLAANGPGSRADISQASYFWGTYLLPNIIFQGIINGALANRGFHHEVAKLADEHPGLLGLLPAEAVAVDLTVTFMFVCNFTFLAAIMYTLSGIYLGIVPLEGTGTGKARNGFLMFLFMLLLGLLSGILFGVIASAAGAEYVSRATAFAVKAAWVVIAVYLGSAMARKWASKKVMEHLASQAAPSSEQGMPSAAGR